MLKMSITALVPTGNKFGDEIEVSPRTVYFISDKKKRTDAVKCMFTYKVVDFLNEVNHRGSSDWQVNEDSIRQIGNLIGNYPDGTLTEVHRNGTDQYDFSAKGCGCYGIEKENVIKVN